MQISFIKSSLDKLLTQTQNYSDILNAVIAFSGFVLAIFFTLISLPVQNVLGRYSQDFVRRITGSVTFILSFTFLGLIFLYNLIVLGFKLNSLLIGLSIVSGTLSFLILANLVRHTFRQLDIRNQIIKISSKIKKQIKIKVRKQERKKKNEFTALKFPASTDLGDALTRFEVHDSVIEWLKTETEIIIDVIQKAIQENRFEIVDSALSNLADLAQEYLEAREKYLTERDAFLTYLYEKLIDMKNLVHKNSHPKIMLSIINTAKDLAIESLKIKPIRAQFGENFLPLGFINLLQNICLSQEILKETSYAPMAVCDHLFAIGEAAIDHEFPVTAHIVAQKLGEISRAATKLHFLYADYIAEKANSGVAHLLNYSLRELDKIRVNREIILKSIAEEINKNLKVYFEDDYSYMMRSNIKTFFGPLADSGIAAIFTGALQQPREDERDYSYVLELLEGFLLDLYQNVMLAMNQKKPLDAKDILDHIYMVGIALVGFVKRISNSEQRKKALEVLDRSIFYIFHYPISIIFKKEYNIALDYYLEPLFSLIGIMFFENKGGEFSQILENWTSGVIEIIQKNKNKIYITHNGKKFKNYRIIHPLTDLYQYIRLTGSWFMKYLPTSKILNDIVMELKAQPKEAEETDYIGVKLYPKSLKSLGKDEWHVERPYLPFDSKYFADLDNELYDHEAIESFEKLLVRKKSSK